MLKELAEKDNYWRKQAFNICKDRTLADDIVQEMYIYFSDKNIKVNDYYIVRKLYCIFIDFIRKDKEQFSLDVLYHVEDKQNTFEIDDDNIKYFNNFEKLNKLQKELIEEYYISEKSLRDIQKEYPLINYGFAYRQIKEAKEFIINGKER